MIEVLVVEHGNQHFLNYSKMFKVALEKIKSKQNQNTLVRKL